MRRLVPLLVSLALLGPPMGTVAAAPAPLHAVQGAIGCTALSQGDYGLPVRMLQGDLAQLGFFRGAVTGVFSGTTTAALDRFQHSQGLPATGVLNTATLSAIERAMGITGPGPNCNTSGGSGSTSDTGSTNSGTSSTSTGPTAGNAGSPGSPAGASGPPAGSSRSPAGSSIRAVSPPPRLAMDYEYASVNGAWNSGFALGGAGSCARQSAYGAWDASNGYSGVVLSLGDPLGLQRHAGGLTQAESMLRTAETCFAQGFASVSPHNQPVIYIGLSNCIQSAGASGSCGSRSTTTAPYARAGTTAAEYVASGTSDVKGAWGDFESDWSTMAAVHAEVLAYLAANPARSGRAQWCDSTYRNDQPGLPNSTWTTTSMVGLYISPLVQAGYNCLGTKRILIPQAYLASWLTNGAANFSPTSSLAAYVGGVTVCGASESTGRCPDLGISASPGRSTKWSDYVHDGYAGAASSVLAVVAGSRLRISLH